MELGGHAPFIVFDDADLDVVVPAAVAAKFQTSGQDCLAANRFLVARPLYEQFNVRLAAAISKLKVGPGLEPGMDIGPLIGQVAVGRCATHVEDALAKGARLLTGGRAGTPGPNYFQPTLLADVTSQMRIFHEETFGPVAAVTPFDADQEAVALANDSEFALAAYLQGGDLRRLWRTAEHLEYGMIAINTVKMTGPPVPFGGMKQSGLGREGARQGISEYLEAKYLCVSGLVDA
jgi:acyl-CoA reductase-like NAD-dependent aldehyde dehydrogenase